MALLEGLERLVHGARPHVDLGGAAPDHHEPFAVVVGLEAPDVLADRLGELPLVRGRLHVRPVELLHVLRVERRRHGLHAREEVLHGIEVLLLVQHPRLHGALVSVVGDGIPRAEHEVLEPRQRDEVLDERSGPLGPLAQSNGLHLGQGADRLGQAAPGGLDAGDEGGGHRAEAGQQYAELTLGRLDL